MSGKVFLNGYIDVPAERLEAVLTALPVHIDLTRSEPGCLEFNVTECGTVSGRLLVAEVFESQEAFDAHQARTKASEWFDVTAGLKRNYSVTSENGRTLTD